MTPDKRLEVAVLGLGEAGGTIAAGLAAAGCGVRAWDPVVTATGSGEAAQMETPEGRQRYADAITAGIVAFLTRT